MNFNTRLTNYTTTACEVLNVQCLSEQNYVFYLLLKQIFSECLLPELRMKIRRQLYIRHA